MREKLREEILGMQGTKISSFLEPYANVDSQSDLKENLINAVIDDIFFLYSYVGFLRDIPQYNLGNLRYSDVFKSKRRYYMKKYQWRSEENIYNDDQILDIENNIFKNMTSWMDIRSVKKILPALIFKVWNSNPNFYKKHRHNIDMDIDKLILLPTINDHAVEINEILLDNYKKIYLTAGASKIRYIEQYKKENSVSSYIKQLFFFEDEPRNKKYKTVEDRWNKEFTKDFEAVYSDYILKGHDKLQVPFHSEEGVYSEEDVWYFLTKLAEKPTRAVKNRLVINGRYISDFFKLFDKCPEAETSKAFSCFIFNSYIRWFDYCLIEQGADLRSIDIIGFSTKQYLKTLKQQCDLEDNNNRKKNAATLKSKPNSDGESYFDFTVQDEVVELLNDIILSKVKACMNEDISEADSSSMQSQSEIVYNEIFQQYIWSQADIEECLRDPWNYIVFCKKLLGY